MRYTKEQVEKYSHFLKPDTIEIQGQERKNLKKLDLKHVKVINFLLKQGIIFVKNVE